MIFFLNAIIVIRNYIYKFNYEEEKELENYLLKGLQNNNKNYLILYATHNNTKEVYKM